MHTGTYKEERKTIFQRNLILFFLESNAVSHNHILSFSENIFWGIINMELS